MAIYGNPNPYLALARAFMQGAPMNAPAGLAPQTPRRPGYYEEAPTGFDPLAPGAPRQTLSLPFASPRAFAQTRDGMSALEYMRNTDWTKSPNARPQMTPGAEARRGQVYGPHTKSYGPSRAGKDRTPSTTDRTPGR